MVPKIRAESIAVSGENTMMWHQRLGYIREKGLQILHGNGMVEGMPNFPLDFNFCEHLYMGSGIG